MQATEPNDLVNFVLNNVLPVYKPALINEIEIITSIGRGVAISEAVRGFNPEFDVTNQLKALVGTANLVEKIADKIEQVHAVQFGKLYQAATTKEKKPTKKQLEKAELMELRKEAHLRMANRPARKTTVKK